MAGNKYLQINPSSTGPEFIETASLQTSAGAGSAGNIVALNSSGQVDSTMLPAATGTSLGIAYSISNANFLFSTG